MVTERYEKPCLRFTDASHTRCAHARRLRCLQAASGAQNARGQSSRVSLYTKATPRFSRTCRDSLFKVSRTWLWNPLVHASTRPLRKALHIQTAIFREAGGPCPQKAVVWALCPRQKPRGAGQGSQATARWFPSPRAERDFVISLFSWKSFHSHVRHT